MVLFTAIQGFDIGQQMTDKVLEFSGRGMAAGEVLQPPQGGFTFQEMSAALSQATKVLVQFVKLTVQAAQFLLIPGPEIVPIRDLLQIIEHPGQHNRNNILPTLQDTGINRFQTDEGYRGKGL